MEIAKMLRYRESICKTKQQEAKQVLAVRGFLDLFHFRAAALFTYSALNETGEGIIRACESGISSIREIREDVRTIPPMHAAIQAKRADLIDSTSLARHFPAKYVQGLSYPLVVPICSGALTIGCATLSRYAGPGTIGTQMLRTLTIYGQMIGEAFMEQEQRPRQILSNREREVLQRMAWGEYFKEMAWHMGISEYTVRDYIKSALQKMNAKNRTEAVAIALRTGIIK
ncbi:response regulator transcription factor [Brevibacillus massiliensis]|uniref:response regulator transcription factor n=1 Tax=Brevibacillus massiliensis TaxID=1118054 RepID=UPI0002F44115|nr:LuxR C-terminal-related transcriptional regulator [Brevibacillus massiliensis]